MNLIRRLVIDGRRLTASRTGVGRYLETLLHGWTEIGWPLDETVLVIQDRAGRDRVPRSGGLTVVAVGEGWPGLVWERFGLGRVLRPGDLLFAPTNLLPRSWRGPTVLVVFDTLLEAVPRGFSTLTQLRFRGRYRSSARRASRIIVPSDATGRDVVCYYGVDPGRVRTIYPAIGPEFRPRSADDPLVIAARRAGGVGDAPFFLFVGKRSARRNVEAVLFAFSCLPDRSERTARLVFVGPEGGYRLDPNMPGVIAAGHVSDNILVGLLSTATACLYPSDYEGFGLPVVEAMASGCPVVTVRSPALIESGGDAAWSLDRADPRLLVDAMARLLGPERSARVALGLEQAARFRGPGFAEAVREEIRAEAGLASGAARR